MLSFVVLLSTLLMSYSLLAQEKYAARPADRINCSHENNPIVSQLYKFSVLNDEQTIKLAIVWNVGRCKDIIEDKGHTSRFMNKAKFFQNDAEEIEGLKISSSKIENGKYMLTEIEIPVSTLERGNHFSLHLSTGLFFGSSKWNFEINEEIKNNKTKYTINY